MPTKRQIISRLKFALLHGWGVPPELVKEIDFEGFVDSSLSYSENLAIIVDAYPWIKKYIPKVFEPDLERYRAEFEEFLYNLYNKVLVGDKEAIETMHDLGFKDISSFAEKLVEEGIISKEEVEIEEKKPKPKLEKLKNVIWSGVNSVVTLESTYLEEVFGAPKYYHWYLKRDDEYKLLFSWKQNTIDKSREYEEFKSEYERWKENEKVWDLIKDDIKRFIWDKYREFEYNKDVLKNWKLYPEAYISTAYGLRKIVSVSPDWWVYDGERSWSCHPNTTIYIPKGVEKKEKKEEKITYEDLIKALSKVYATDEKGIIYTLIGLLFDGVSPEDLKDSLTKIACDVIQGASPELVEDAVDTLVAIAVRGYKSRKEIYKVEKERKIAPEIKPEITVEEVREDYSKFINEGNFSMAAMLDYLISRKGARWNPKIEEALEVLIEGGYPEEKVEKIKSWFWK